MDINCLKDAMVRRCQEFITGSKAYWFGAIFSKFSVQTEAVSPNSHLEVPEKIMGNLNVFSILFRILSWRWHLGVSIQRMENCAGAEFELGRFPPTLSAEWAHHTTATNWALETDIMCIGISPNFFQNFQMQIWTYSLCLSWKLPQINKPCSQWQILNIFWP